MSAQFECGVCWYVYDPADGDPVWQVAPGTAFKDLPDEWCCPVPRRMPCWICRPAGSMRPWARHWAFRSRVIVFADGHVRRSGGCRKRGRTCSRRAVCHSRTGRDRSPNAAARLGASAS